MNDEALRVGDAWRRSQHDGEQTKLAKMLLRVRKPLRPAVLAVFIFVLSGCGLLPIENTPHIVEVENPNAFDLVQLQGVDNEPWQDTVNRKSERGYVLTALRANASRRLGSKAGQNRETDGLFCAGEDVVWHFFRVLDSTGWDRPREDSLDARGGYSSDDLELEFTLVPGYCFEDRFGAEYLLGDPYLTRPANN